MFSSPRRAVRLGLSLACLSLTLVFGPSGRVGAHSTVFFDEAGDDAPHISLIGDSTLAGVRWWGNFGELRRYNFVLDAESCRRTLEESCWSREDYRPDNTVAAMQRLAGELGDVVVVMSGYNDSGYLFDDAVDAVVAEARRQEIRHVVWLTLRDLDVSYEDPQERANAEGYREDNLLLYEKAAELGGFLQVADWATDAWDRPEWFEYDGVHLTAEGVRGLTTFIADRVEVVLEGGSLNPDVAPWTALRAGASGPAVALVQRALQVNGVTTVGVVDGAYGDQTAAAVEAFQDEHGLRVTGVVDEDTAVALGVVDATDLAASRVIRPSARPSSPPNVATVHALAPLGAEVSTVTRPVAAAAMAGTAAIAVAGLLYLLRRNRRVPSTDHAPPADDEFPRPAPYNYELEESLTG